MPAQDNLPSTTTRLIGRDGDIDTILGQFKTSQLVTLVGAGGIDKTSVALAIAKRATALGLVVHSSNIEAALFAFLRERRLMLTLDNCEHLLDAVASFAERLLAGVSDIQILANRAEILESAMSLVDTRCVSFQPLKSGCVPKIVKPRKVPRGVACPARRPN